MPSAGAASASSTPAARASDTAGRASTTRMVAAQNRLSPVALRCRKGIRGRSILSPSRLSTAGSTVSEPSTATATTRTVPIAIDRKTACPDSSSPHIETTTATPEVTTARPLVAAAMSIACDRVAPCVISSRMRRT